jgi:hypothetical protein
MGIMTDILEGKKPEEVMTSKGLEKFRDFIKDDGNLEKLNDLKHIKMGYYFVRFKSKVLANLVQSK